MVRRSFTKEFKLDVIKQVSLRPLIDVCKEFELLPVLVKKWQREYSKNPVDSFRGKGNLAKDKAKVAELERLIGRLYSENSFLKSVLEKLEERRSGK